tara:strand:+ start:23 stop:310 length:288 start_codon:yes stop_codon:yes gene_type:complete
MTSRSQKGKTALCVGCKEESYYYVAIHKGYGGSMEKHWYVCMNCYHQDLWQEAVSKIKPPTKPSKPKRIRKPSVKLKAGAWDDSIKKVAKPTLDW